MDAIKIKQIIGQLEASIDKMESEVTLADFKDYCDAASVLITFWRVLLKKVNEDG